MAGIIPIVLRSFQFLFSAIILGISVHLIKGQGIGSAPATTGYVAFTGGLGLIAASVGIVSMFIESLEGIITLIFDGLSGLTLLAGGIAAAIGLRNVSCTFDLNHAMDTILNPLLNGGSFKKDGRVVPWYSIDEKNSLKFDSRLANRCREYYATEAFMWMTFLISAALLTLAFLKRKKGGILGSYA